MPSLDESGRPPTAGAAKVSVTDPARPESAVPAFLKVVRLLVLVLIASSSPAGDPARLAQRTTGQSKPVPVTDDVKAAARSANAFAFDLDARLTDRDGNLFLAPAGLWSVLATAAAGADGETERQMLAVLHADLPEEQFLAACAALGRINDTSGGGYTLSTADRIWAAKDSPPIRPYLKLVKAAGVGEPARIDFARPDQAREVINGWAAQETNGRIADLIPPGALTRDTRLLLTSATYFKADWTAPFEASDTKEEPFRLAGGGTVPVWLMHQSHRFRYGEADGLQLVELPYAGGDLAMVILLPREVGLSGLEPTLTAEAVEPSSSSMTGREVILSLPRFKTAAQFRLGETLGSMGMPLAFSDGADFSGMTTCQAARITDVAHAGSIDVNERGTEAAAATALIGGLGGALGKPAPPVEFRADRPFVFLIRDRRTGAILFLGRVTDPTK